MTKLIYKTNNKSQDINIGDILDIIIVNNSFNIDSYNRRTKSSYNETIIKGTIIEIGQEAKKRELNSYRLRA